MYSSSPSMTGYLLCSRFCSFYCWKRDPRQRGSSHHGEVLRWPPWQTDASLPCVYTPVVWLQNSYKAEHTPKQRSQPFWHQGPVSQKTIFLWMGGGKGFRDNSSTLNLLRILFLLWLHQLHLRSSLDPRGWHLCSRVYSGFGHRTCFGQKGVSRCEWDKASQQGPIV